MISIVVIVFGAMSMFWPGLVHGLGPPQNYHAAPGLKDTFGTAQFGQPMTVYALIARPDGTLRRAHVSGFAVDAVRAGGPLPLGTIFAIEVMDATGKRGFVDVRQKLADGWSYGRFEPDAVDFFTREAPDECHACHKMSGDGAPSFTRYFLNVFAETGELQKRLCDLPDREICFSAD